MTDTRSLGMNLSFNYDMCFCCFCLNTLCMVCQLYKYTEYKRIYGL